MERPAMDVAGQGERDAPGRRAVERAGTVGEQDLDRVTWRSPQGEVDVQRLGVVRLPGPGVVDADARERGAAPLDHVYVVPHEPLARVAHPADHRVRPSVAVVVA